jgi:hypothetical protein
MFSEKDRAVKMLKDGLYPNLTFGYNISLLSKYYKYINTTEEGCIHNILSWLTTQKIDSPYNEVIEEVIEVVHIIYNRSYKFIDDVNVKIYLEEMRAINKLVTKGERKIAFCLLFLSKIYANKEGIFYCRYKSLEKLSGMQEMQIERVINKLEESKFIDIISRNQIKKILRDNPFSKGVVYKHPNKYKLNLPKVRKVIYTVGDTESLEEHFINIYKICINEYKFDSSVFFKRYIKNYSC